ncbi:MAG: ComF family protein [Blautia sp.]|nr:ComF family protein [Blautia sp.]
MRSSRNDTVLWIARSVPSQKGTVLNNKLYDLILDSVFPRHCPLCNEVLEDPNHLVCDRCVPKIQPLQEPLCKKCGKPVEEYQEYCHDCGKYKRWFDEGRGVFLYDAMWKRSIGRYKFYGCREFGEFYGEAMYQYTHKLLMRWKPELLIPVPLHKRTLRDRGFNQTWKLAERISFRAGIPAEQKLVRKTIYTGSQKKMDAISRRKSLYKAYEMSGDIRKARVLIVDDVFTTGSTIDALAQCLKEHGASEVYFLTLCIGKGF